MELKQEGYEQIRNMARGCSLVLLLLHYYFFLHGALQLLHLTFPLTDRLVTNLIKSGLFNHVYSAKALALCFWLLSLLIVNASSDRIHWKKITAYGLSGLLLYFGSAAVLDRAGDPVYTAAAYLLLTVAGFWLLSITGTMIASRFTLHFAGDVFNLRNESFPQEERLITNAYSVNLPGRYRFRNRIRHSYINVINCFRATAIWGGPGSGKTYYIIRHFIKQHLEKGFTMFVFDFKYDDLTRIAYNQLLLNEHKFPVKPKFFVIDFDDLEHSHRCNPLDPISMNDVSDASESSRTILLALNREWLSRQGDFFIESAISFITANMWFLRKFENGKYCTLPHLIELIQCDYARLFSVLRSIPEIETLINPFVSAFLSDSMDTLESQAASARIALSGLSSPQLYYVLSANDLTLDINNPEAPKILCAGSNPQKQMLYGAVLSLFITRMIKLVNKRDQLPCSVILDELSTIYFPGLSNLLATARSNRVAVTFAVQSVSLLRSTYGRDNADVLFDLPGNVFCGQANGDTAAAMSDLFGRIMQTKQSVSVNTRSSFSNSQSEHLDLAVPASKISSLSSGEFVGITADNPDQKIKNKTFHCEIINDHAAIQKEEATYKERPKVRVLTDDTVEKNFLKIKEDVINIIHLQIDKMQRSPTLSKKIIVKDELKKMRQKPG